MALDHKISEKINKAKTLLICTNNTELIDKKYIDKLKKFGIDPDMDTILTIDNPTVNIDRDIDIRGNFPEKLKELKITKKFDTIMLLHCPNRFILKNDFVDGLNEYISINGNIYILNHDIKKDILDKFLSLGFNISYIEKENDVYLNLKKEEFKNKYNFDTFIEIFDYVIKLIIKYYDIKIFKGTVTNVLNFKLDTFKKDMNSLIGILHLFETNVKNPYIIEHINKIRSIIYIFKDSKDGDYDNQQIMQIVYPYIYEIMLEIQEMIFIKEPNKIVGFKWFDNLCYLNTVLQIIYHIKELRCFILNTYFDDTYMYYDYLAKKNKKLYTEQIKFLISIQKLLRLYVQKQDKDIIDYEHLGLIQNIYTYLTIHNSNFKEKEFFDIDDILLNIIYLSINSKNFECANKILLLDKETNDNTKNIKYAYLVQFFFNIPPNISTAYDFNEIIKSFHSEVIREYIDFIDEDGVTHFSDGTIINDLILPTLNKYIFIRISMRGTKICNTTIAKTFLNNTYKLKICYIYESSHYYIYLFNDDTVYRISDSNIQLINPYPTELNGLCYIYEKIDYIPDKLEKSMKELNETIKDNPVLKKHQEYLINEQDKFMKNMNF